MKDASHLLIYSINNMKPLLPPKHVHREIQSTLLRKRALITYQVVWGQVPA